MNKILASSAALLLAASVALPVAAADQYENTPLTLTWAVGNESEPALSAVELSAAISSTGVSTGTDLEVSGPSSYNLKAEGTVGPYVVYRPNTGTPGCVPTDMIEYTVKVKKGLTFTPTQVSFDAIKEGTDNAYVSWSYTVDGKESEAVAYSDPKTQIRRNNDANPDAPLTHAEAISAEGGRTFTLRLYLSNVANNKKMALGNIQLSGTLSGEPEVRAFKDFKLDFRTDPYVVKAPEGGLPAGVEVTGGTFHDGQHGYSNTTLTVSVDGPVKFFVGGCGYSNQATVKDASGNLIATIDTKGAGCDTSTSDTHAATWVYNSEEPAVLSFDLGNYCPFFYAEACDLIPQCTVVYYDTDGKTVVGQKVVDGNSPLTYAYGAADVTVSEGYAFRGWFNSQQNTAVKVAEGTAIQDDLKLYARATPIEVPTHTSRYIYEFNKANFYVEDHEAIEVTGGQFHDAQHGWDFKNGSTLSVKVAGKCYLTIGNCRYSADSEATVTDAAGNVIGTFNVKAADTADGAEHTIQYEGDATTLTITFSGTTYVHKVSVFNVLEFMEFDEQTGYYNVPAGDATNFLLALTAANASGNAKIYLPNGIYDLGEQVLTAISGQNISIVGESMLGTIIRNAPPKENEGIGTTATLYNTSDGLYLQDLTLQNALDYYATGSAGRAVCLQDKGKNTICKNVRMLSYQDTYYSNSASKFYWEDSEIHGTVDYLCGDGDVVYNRVKLVNESRAKDVESGDCTVCAPYTSASCQWGYVFLDCEIETLSKTFNLGRSWGGESKAQYLRTKDLSGKLVSSRFTTAGMNVAAYKFKEYKTTDAAGNVITPASHEMTFTHSTGNFTYETVLTDDEAAQYTVQNIYGEWAPDKVCQQVTISNDNLDQLSTLTPAVLLTAGIGSGIQVSQLVPALGIDAAFLTQWYESTKQTAQDLSEFTLRAANGRGGFGPKFDVKAYVEGSTAIQKVETSEASHIIYNIYGQPATGGKGLYIDNGQKMLMR